MAEDEKVKVVIEGDGSGATEAIGGVGESLEGLQEALSAAFEIAGITAAIEAIKKLNEALTESAERATSINVSSASLGITTTQFQGLQVIAAQAGVGMDTLGRTMATLQARMAQAGEEGGKAAEKFNALGITTAELRDPSYTAADAMAQMGAASNSNGAIMAELGARGRALLPVLRELADNHQLAGEAAAKVGALTDSEIGVLEGYHAQVELTATSWDNFKARVLSGAAPAMEALGRAMQSYFADAKNGTEGSNLFTSAIELVGEEVIAFIGQVQDIADVFFAIDRIGIQTFTGLGAAITDAATGHFKQAGADMVQIGTDVKASWQAMFSSFETNSNDAAAKLKAFTAAVQAPAQAEAKPAATNVGTLPDLSGDADKMRDVMNKTDDAISAHMAEALKAGFKEVLGSATATADAEFTAQDGSINRQIAAVQNLAKTKQITAAQELAQVSALLEQQWALEEAHFHELEALNGTEPAKLDALQKQEEAAYQKHLDAMAKAQQQYTTASLQQWQTISNGITNAFTQNFDKVLNGTESMTKAMTQMFLKMGESIVQTFVKIAVQQAVNAAISKATGTAAAKSNVMANAAQAASGAMASAASIPYVGWILAPMAGAAVYAAALAFPSAAGGWDVPKGINPITQIHSGEMVLPQHLADGVRAMTGQGGGGGTTHNHSWNISALDGHSVKSFLRDPSNRRMFQAALS